MVQHFKVVPLVRSVPNALRLPNRPVGSLSSSGTGSSSIGPRLQQMNVDIFFCAFFTNTSIMVRFTRSICGWPRNKRSFSRQKMRGDPYDLSSFQSLTCHMAWRHEKTFFAHGRINVRIPRGFHAGHWLCTASHKHVPRDSSTDLWASSPSGSARNGPFKATIIVRAVHC